VRGACTSAPRRGDCGGQIHVDAQRGGLRHDVSDLGAYGVGSDVSATCERVVTWLLPQGA